MSLKGSHGIHGPDSPAEAAKSAKDNGPCSETSFWVVYELGLVLKDSFGLARSMFSR
jgi:hypothetical protein